MQPFFFLALQALLVMGGALALALICRKRLPALWSSWLWGGGAWIASQLLRMPLLIGLTLLFQRVSPSPADVDPNQVFWVNLVILAGTSGPFEELARYFILKRAARKTRGWREAIMFGAGHGGVEAMLLIGFGALQSIVLLLTADTVLAQRAAIPAEQLVAIEAQIKAVREVGPMVFVGVIERAFAICFHIALAVMVTYAAEFGKRRWLIAAILAHIGLNAAALIGQHYGGVWAAEAVVAIAGIAALSWTWAQKRWTPPAAHAPV